MQITALNTAYNPSNFAFTRAGYQIVVNASWCARSQGLSPPLPWALAPCFSSASGSSFCCSLAGGGAPSSATALSCGTCAGGSLGCCLLAQGFPPPRSCAPHLSTEPWQPPNVSHPRIRCPVYNVSPPRLRCPMDIYNQTLSDMQAATHVGGPADLNIWCARGTHSYIPFYSPGHTPPLGTQSPARPAPRRWPSGHCAQRRPSCVRRLIAAVAWPLLVPPPEPWSVLQP